MNKYKFLGAILHSVYRILSFMTRKEYFYADGVEMNSPNIIVFWHRKIFTVCNATRIIKKKAELYLAAGPDHSSLQGAGSHKASFLPATVVFMDPPYAVSSQDCSHMVALLAERGWMADDAVLIVERSARSEAVMAPQGWEITDSRLYGETRVDYLGHCRNGV